MGLLAQEDELVRGDLQRIARLAEDVLGRVERAVDDLVERAAGAHRAKGEQRGERAVFHGHGGLVDHLGDNVLRERVALADGAHHVERRQASRRGVGLATRTCRFGRTAEAALLAAARRALGALLRLATRVASGVTAAEIGLRLARGAIGAGMLRGLGALAALGALAFEIGFAVALEIALRAAIALIAATTVVAPAVAAILALLAVASTLSAEVALLAVTAAISALSAVAALAITAALAAITATALVAAAEAAFAALAAQAALTIAVAAVLAALSIAAVAAFAALTRRTFVVMLFSHAGPPKSWCLP